MFKLVSTILLSLSLSIGTVSASDLGIKVEGDSVALGAGNALTQILGYKVPNYAVSSKSSCWIFKNEPGGYSPYWIISAGINDEPGFCVSKLLDRLTGTVVVILPAPISTARANVLKLASKQRPGQKTLTISYQCEGKCTKSNFHPGNYKTFGKQILKLLKLK